jgi:hypothetical protein
MVVVIDGNSGDDRIRRTKTLGDSRRKSSGGTTLKKTCTVRAYREEGRQRSSDRWIPFKFPKRPIAVRSAESAQRLSTGAKSYCAEEKSWRNRDRPFARTSGKESRIGFSRVSCSITTKTPKSRYAILRFDRSHRARSDLDR